tara:strand:+ start:485 stop:1096 length:612 start_codon:yes stop_codon:yes gene_type:complete
MSTLKVGTIQDHANSNTAISIDSSGRPILSGQPCVAVQCSNANNFGTTHADTTYDTTYRTPIPLFTSGTTTTQLNRGGMTLSFPSHPSGSGNFAKIIVPATGIYEYHFYGCGYNQDSNDWLVLGLMKNNQAEASTGNLTFGGMNYQVSNASDQADSLYFNACHSTVMSLTANDYVVPFAQSANKVMLMGMTGGQFGFVLKQIA